MHTMIWLEEDWLVCVPTSFLFFCNSTFITHESYCRVGGVFGGFQYLSASLVAHYEHVFVITGCG